MASINAASTGILFALWLIGGAVAQGDFDFFYLVVQWPGSYCDLKTACCYPKSGKPAAQFSIHGLWPNYADGHYPSNCNPSDPFDLDQVSDLQSQLDSSWGSLSCPSSDSTQFWSHEWSKHGTCSGLSQHEYFASALTLYNSIDLVAALNKAGIDDNDLLYSVTSIQTVLAAALGHNPGIECNRDASRQDQIYQIYICVNTTATEFIDCPVYPKGKCNSKVGYPSF